MWLHLRWEVLCVQVTLRGRTSHSTLCFAACPNFPLMFFPFRQREKEPAEWPLAKTRFTNFCGFQEKSVYGKMLRQGGGAKGAIRWACPQRSLAKGLFLGKLLTWPQAFHSNLHLSPSSPNTPTLHTRSCLTRSFCRQSE